MNRCHLMVNLFSECPDGQGYEYFNMPGGCHPCAEGRYRNASDYYLWCQRCPSPDINGVEGATDKSSCTSMYPKLNVSIEFFHNSRLIGRIQKNKIDKKFRYLTRN